MTRRRDRLTQAPQAREKAVLELQRTKRATPDEVAMLEAGLLSRN